MERRDFQMHHNLLRDVIEKQAGTLDKAVLEGVMNAVEARSPKTEITLTPDTLTIRDYGKGFETRDEVLAAFEVFGKSDERKKEDKRWARFQMGRGQLFAFGRTTYRTRTFRMTVDIRDESMGLGYALEEGLPDFAGCEVTVQLYAPLGGYDISKNETQIAMNVKYVDLPIFFNGKQVSVDPAKESWTQVTDDAYIRVQSTGRVVKIYNLGVFVKDEYGMGCGGVLISRKQMELNFARNDVIRNQCEVWRKTSKFFRAQGEKALLEKATFSPEDVAEVLSRVANGEITKWQAQGLKLFKNTNNKRLSLNDLVGKRLAFDAAGSIMADKVMQMNRDAVVLDTDHTFAALSTYSAENAGSALIATFRKIMERASAPPKLVSPQSLYATVSGTEIILRDKDLKVDEKMALGALNYWLGTGSRAARHLERKARPRKIILGRAPAYQAWTDGSRWIAFDRKFFRKCIQSGSGWVHLLDTLAHEYAHQGSERTHDGDFYERYHEIMDSVSETFDIVYKDYVQRLLAATRKLGYHGPLVKTMEELQGPFVHEAPESDGFQGQDEDAAASVAPTKPTKPPRKRESHTKTETPTGKCRCGNAAKVKDGKVLKNCQDCIDKAVARWSKNVKGKAS